MCPCLDERTANQVAHVEHADSVGFTAKKVESIRDRVDRLLGRFLGDCQLALHQTALHQTNPHAATERLAGNTGPGIAQYRRTLPRTCGDTSR